MSLDPQSEPYLYSVLRFVAHEFGRTITTEECQAECNKLVQDGAIGSSTMSAALAGTQKGHLDTVLTAVRKAWTVQPPTAGQRRTSLPLDRRRGGEILLSEEQVQLAMSLGQSGETDNQPQTQHEEDGSGQEQEVQDEVTVSFDLETDLGPLNWKGYFDPKCGCPACQKYAAAHPVKKAPKKAAPAPTSK